MQSQVTRPGRPCAVAAETSSGRSGGVLSRQWRYVFCPGRDGNGLVSQGRMRGRGSGIRKLWRGGRLRVGGGEIGGFVSRALGFTTEARRHGGGWRLRSAVCGLRIGGFGLKGGGFGVGGEDLVGKDHGCFRWGPTATGVLRRSVGEGATLRNGAVVVAGEDGGFTGFTRGGWSICAARLMSCQLPVAGCQWAALQRGDGG